MPRSRAVRRYNGAVLILSAAYAGLLFAATFLFQRHVVSGPTAYLAAVLPALPIIGVFAAIGRYLVEERDEYIRSLMVRQTLIASGFALAVATVWGFLESFDLAPHLEAYWVAVLWFGGLGLGACVNKLTAGREA